MTDSVNGDKNGNQQWDRNDEIKDCEPPEGSPPDKVSPRPQTFCTDGTMLQNLAVSGDVVIDGNVTIAGNLTVSGTITAPFFDGLAARAIVAGSLG